MAYKLVSIFNLANAEGLKAHLSQTDEFPSKDVVPLTGGTGNFVFRVFLEEQYEGHDTVIVKHAEDYLPSDKNFHFPSERQDFEVRALNVVNTMLEGDLDSLVKVPKVLHYDEDNRLIIMTDCGEHSYRLKDLLLRLPPSSELSKTIGTQLGHFVGTLHTVGNTEKFRSAKQFFGTNKIAREISSTVTNSRIVSTLAPSENDKVFIRPPIEIPEPQIQVMRSTADWMSKIVMSNNDHILMGDFWPGNILINLTSDLSIQSIWVIDWELTKTGCPGFEIGQFSAELFQAAHFYPDSRLASRTILDAFVEAYKSKCRVEPTTGWIAAMHMGAHLIAWTPRTGWGNDEETRAAVLHRISFLGRGFMKDEA
ncbi:hypothetical protein SISSUDRAFT_1118377 [Sistotremastrum suecicum HHB10207 ss-3]|uniref:Aminoglycoside phosphotransferase domain-containing protein n=1 Tax=Sistotremastrum suecicum HHB10207 ss-3 TaxID=1314776 RepID=A0A166F5W5_9AGAM|nr:hypothetical protein SISSUDRAFT_1118377 [Sistotremastrum suecicum HHB10207 ss-3]